MDIENRINELEAESGEELDARILLVRCKLIGVKRPQATERRHQRIVANHVLRALARRFSAQVLLVPISAADILVVVQAAALAVSFQ